MNRLLGSIFIVVIFQVSFVYAMEHTAPEPVEVSNQSQLQQGELVTQADEERRLQEQKVAFWLQLLDDAEQVGNEQ